VGRAAGRDPAACSCPRPIQVPPSSERNAVSLTPNAVLDFRFRWLLVAPRPQAASSKASRHQGRARVLLGLVVRFPSFYQLLSQLGTPSPGVHRGTRPLAFARYPFLHPPHFPPPNPTSLTAVGSAACTVAVAAVPWKQQLPSPTPVPVPVQPVSPRSSPCRVSCPWAGHMGSVSLDVGARKEVTQLGSEGGWVI
jgi:hypothetical protein